MGSQIGDEIVQGLEEVTEALEAGEQLSRRFTLRTIVLDLNPTDYSAEKVKETRAMIGASQSVFAQFIGVSLKTLQAWEHGDNPVTGSAARLMDEIRHDPQRWIKRLTELAVEKVPHASV